MSLVKSEDTKLYVGCPVMVEPCNLYLFKLVPGCCECCSNVVPFRMRDVEQGDTAYCTFLLTSNPITNNHTNCLKSVYMNIYMDIIQIGVPKHSTPCLYDFFFGESTFGFGMIDASLGSPPACVVFLSVFLPVCVFSGSVHSLDIDPADVPFP